MKYGKFKEVGAGVHEFHIFIHKEILKEVVGRGRGKEGG